MKLTKARLRQIIKEEIAAQTGPFPSPESMAAFEQSNGEEWDDDGLIMDWLKSIPGFLEALKGKMQVFGSRDPAVKMVIDAYNTDPRSMSV